MRWVRSAAVVAAVLLGATACSAGGPAGTSGSEPAVLPTAPAVPAGAVRPTASQALDQLVAAPLDLDDAAVEVVGRSGDARLAWLLVDLLRFQLDFESDPPLLDGLDRLTGYRAPTDPSTVAWVAYADALLRWDTPAPPGYLDWKRQIYLAVEPAWEPFFDDDASTLDWRHVMWGGVARDAIAALVDPTTLAANDGSWLPDEDVVFGVVVDGQARAYPRRIMEVHELANDTLGGRRIGIPYCTLCGTAVGYYLDRQPAGVGTLELRTSGLLQRSNKLMYDARTESLLDQFSGQALTGPLAEKSIELERFSVVTTTWAEWRHAHPETTILAADPGTGRDYEADPLGGRDDNGPIFPIGQRDDRLPVQEPVVGVVTPTGVAVAFAVAEAKAELAAGQPVTLAGVKVRLDAGGLIAVLASGPELPTSQSFWFAWSQFHPGTLLWRAP